MNINNRLMIHEAAYCLFVVVNFVIVCAFEKIAW